MDRRSRQDHRRRQARASSVRFDPLEGLQKSADTLDEEVRKLSASGSTRGFEGGLKAGDGTIGGEVKAQRGTTRREEIEKTFRQHQSKLQELDRWLPDLKNQLREFFQISTNVKAIYLQIDDLYHLRRADQAFVVDYIPVSYTHLRSPRDGLLSRMPSSA